MAYIGNTQQDQNYVPAIDYFSGNGSTTAFTLSRPVASVAQVQAVIENVPQNPGDAYTVSGNTITFTSAPPSGTNNIYVYYTSPNTQVTALPQSPVVYGNLNFGSTGARIQGDFSTATLANRVMFQTSTTNGATNVYAIPNGTGTTAGYTLANNSDPSNAGITQVVALSTESSLRAAITGTGTYLPMTFYTGGSERMRIDTSGNVGIGTNNPQATLNVAGQIRIDNNTTDPNNGAPYLFQQSGVGWNMASLNIAFTTGTSGARTERMRITSNGGVSFGSSGTNFGTSGQVLQSNGDAAPTWTTISTSAFPAGTRMSFQQTSAPTGWTKDTTAALNDSIMRIVTGAASSGGSTAFSTFNGQTATGATTLATTQIPSHTHQQQSFSTINKAQGVSWSNNSGASTTLTTTNVPSTQGTGGGGSHTHGMTTSIKYYDFIIASKD